MKTAYPYTMQRDEDGFLFVQFVDLEEAFTQGATVEEAEFNAGEVLRAILAFRLDNNQIPRPSICPEHGFTALPSVIKGECGGNCIRPNLTHP